MKLNKKWCIFLIMILVIMTTVPIFADSAGSAESGGFLRQIFRVNPKTMLLGVIGGGLGVAFSFLKGKDSRKRR